ncbi:MAG: acetyl-CoA carboxylase biotin carboxyl carrier protein [Pseudomonadota bacterium]
MDIRKVKKLIELLEESGIAEIEITEGDDAVRISRYPQGGAPAMIAPQPIPMTAPAAAPAPAAAAAEPAAAPEPAVEDEGHVVSAPMVGTFYSSSAPGAAPFVQIGDRVKAGDTLCIVEAMKMMNQIECDVDGVVKSIRVQNGEPVEYGQALVTIDTRG